MKITEAQFEYVLDSLCGDHWHDDNWGDRNVFLCHELGDAFRIHPMWPGVRYEYPAASAILRPLLLRDGLCPYGDWFPKGHPNYGADIRTRNLSRLFWWLFHKQELTSD